MDPDKGLIWQGKGTTKSEDQEEKKELRSTMGSGFYVSSEGHIITNYHVVEGANEIKISGHSAELIAHDPSNDLALLKIAEPSPSFATFRKESTIKIGEDIFTFGFPLAGLISSSGSISVGTISALAGVGDNVSQLQISVPVQPGNSGGPLLDKKGAVVGVVVSMLDKNVVEKMTGQPSENVNFAINAATVKAFLNANNVTYRESGWSDFNKSNEDIAAAAQKFSVKVECFR